VEKEMEISMNVVARALAVFVILSMTGSLVSADNAPKTAAQTGFGQGHPPKRLVDISQWDKGEDSRWAFQHISEFLPTANITRGSGIPYVLDRAPKSLGGVSFKTYEGRDMTIEQLLMETYTDGFLVMQDGAIVYEKYFNGMKPTTRHLIMSTSKSVTATLAGILVNDGRLDPDKLVIDYIPEMKDSEGFADTTVRHVLDMTTSIIFSEDYADPKSEVVAHEEASGWRGDTPLAREGLYAYMPTIRKDASREHGQKFHYASINADVLGWIIERASGQRFHEFMEQELWSKLGAEHDAEIAVAYDGAATATGGMCFTLRDFGRFGQMMLDDGHYNGHQIIPSGWVDDTRYRGNNAAWTKFDKIWPKGWYRNMWYVTNDEQGSYFAVGVNGQNLWINPTTRVVIVKLSSTPVSSDPSMQFPSWAGMDAIARYLGTAK
jgi:CubicO group peptidase (beta-lactamase class C family)